MWRRGYEEKPLYFINTPTPVADAVVTEVKGNRAKVWLGGVDLGRIDSGTVFAVIEGSGQVELRSRNGLIGEGMVEGGVKEGMLLRQEI